MLVRPARRSAAPRRAAFTLLEVLVVLAIVVVMAGVSSVYVFRYLEDANKDAARMGMQAVEQAYNTAMLRNGGNPPNYPADVIPYLTQGQAALQDPWGGTYQMTMVQTEVGERPQFYCTSTKDQTKVVWPQK